MSRHAGTEHSSPTAAAPASSEETTPTGRVLLELDGVTKRFGENCAVEDVSFSVHEGELLTLLGPSGCGKSTTLRLIAGLETPDDGTIRLDGDALATDSFSRSPENRDIGIVFQEFALFPHLDAAENVAFGLRESEAVATQKRVDELLDLVGLGEFADAMPDELSGGQRQRIALARSLAVEPEILLLDEPFSNLDVGLRVRMREEVRRILKEAGVTGISVTHDQEEALSISDRVAVMNAGRIEQIGEPEDVFQQPTSRFVASFLGHASFLSAYVAGDIVETGIGRIGRDQINGLAPEYDQMRLDVMVRPDDVVARPVDSTDDANGVVTYRRYLGPSVLCRVELDNGDIVECMHNHVDDLDLDEPVRVELPASHELAWFPSSDELRADGGQ